MDISQQNLSSRKSCAAAECFPKCALNRHISISGCYFSCIWSVKRPTKWEETRLLFFRLQVRLRQDFLQEAEMLTESAGIKTRPSVSPLTSCHTASITSFSPENPVSTKRTWFWGLAGALPKASPQRSGRLAAGETLGIQGSWGMC